MKKILALSLVLAALVGCKTNSSQVVGGTGNPVIETGVVTSDGKVNGKASASSGGDYWWYPWYTYQTWYDVYGYACYDLMPGCTYVDDWSSLKAMWWDDPYYDYWADPVLSVVFDTDYGYYVEAWGYYGYNNVFYDYYTGRAINEGDEETSRDVLSVVGNREEEVVQKAGKAFADKYQLDTEIGVRVARVMNDWNKITKFRERTDEDMKVFSEKLYGVSIDKVKTAIETGNEAEQNQLLDEAAKTWKTSPQNMKTILKNMYLN